MNSPVEFLDLTCILILVIPQFLVSLLKLLFQDKKQYLCILRSLFFSLCISFIIGLSLMKIPYEEDLSKLGTKFQIYFSLGKISFFISCFSVILQFNFVFSKPHIDRFILCFILLLLSFILINSAKFSIKSWGKIDYQQLLYHLLYPDKTADSVKFLEEWIKVYLVDSLKTSIIVLIPLIIIFPCEVSFDSSIFCFNGIEEHTYLLHADIIGFIILIGSAIKSINMMGLFNPLNFETTDIFDKYYVDPASVHVQFPEEKQNLIILFLESMEMTFASKVNGGGYRKSQIPELEELALDPKNIHFSDTNKLGGVGNVALATWTTAAQFAVVSGLPMKSKKFKNRLFYPNVVTLYDILSINGYHLFHSLPLYVHHIGTNYLMETHGNGKIFDSIYIKRRDKIPRKYYIKNKRSIIDKALFDFVKRHLPNIAKKENPFVMVMETCDTHFPNGRLCPFCNMSDDDSRFKVVRRCASRHVYDFINWFKEQPFYHNTTLLITGDHFCLGNDVPNDKEGCLADRKIYNVLINSRVNCKDSHKRNRKMTTFDWFPTILASIGCKVYGDRLGLGTNLFSNKKTIAEQKVDYNNEVIKISKYYQERIQGKDRDPNIRVVMQWLPQNFNITK